MSAVSVLAGMGSTVPWPPQGAGDFADVAWVVAQALGNGAGVRRLNVSHTGRSGAQGSARRTAGT